MKRMKRIGLLIILLGVLFSGCAFPSARGHGHVESWRKIGLKNNSALYMKYWFNGRQHHLRPGREKTHPVYGFGEFRIMISAYRETYDGVLWFVGRKEIALRVDGTTMRRHGRDFADYKTLRGHGWYENRRTGSRRLPEYGGTIPFLGAWKFRFKRK